MEKFKRAVAEKERQEMAECSFAPKLVAKQPAAKGPSADVNDSPMVDSSAKRPGESVRNRKAIMDEQSGLA